MKLIHMAALTAYAALFMLSACGQSDDAGVSAAADTTEITATSASLSRDWMPAAIVLPQPNTVVADRKLGLRTHLLQVVVQNDPTPKFSEWKSALLAAGYKVNDNAANGSLLFQGTRSRSRSPKIMRAS